MAGPAASGNARKLFESGIRAKTGLIHRKPVLFTRFIQEIDDGKGDQQNDQVAAIVYGIVKFIAHIAKQDSTKWPIGR